MREHEDERDALDLLKDLEQRKEKELRAQIEKEEIARTLKEMDRDALTNADKHKHRELEKLGAERENLRITEQTLLDEIKNMEEAMMKKENRF